MTQRTYLRNRDSENELRVAGGRKRGRDSQRACSWHVHTAIFKMDNQQGPTVQHRKLCSILHNNLNEKIIQRKFQFSSVAQSCPLFANPWIKACQASLSITISWSSLKLTSIDLVMPSSHLILCCLLLLLPQSFPASESFPVSWIFTRRGQSTGVSALASVLPKGSQGWSPSEWTGWISLQSKGLSRVFSNTAVQKHQFFGSQSSSQSNSHIHIWPLEKS